MHPVEQASANLEPRAMTGGSALQVDASAIRDLQDASKIDGYTLPKLYRSVGQGKAFVQNPLCVCSAHFRAWASGLSRNIWQVQQRFQTVEEARFCKQ